MTTAFCCFGFRDGAFGIASLDFSTSATELSARLTLSSPRSRESACIFSATSSSAALASERELSDSTRLSVPTSSKFDVNSFNVSQPSWLRTELSANEGRSFLTEWRTPFFHFCLVDDFEVFATFLVPHQVTVMRQFLVWFGTESVAASVVYISFVNEVVQIRCLEQP